MPHRRFNANASAHLAQYESRAIILRRGTENRATATQEAVTQSQALIVKVDAVFAGDAMRLGWLWPVY